MYKENPEEFDENEDEPLESVQAGLNDNVKNEADNSNVGALASNRVLSPIFHTLKTISESRGKRILINWNKLLLWKNY